MNEPALKVGHVDTTQTEEIKAQPTCHRMIPLGESQLKTRPRGYYDRESYSTSIQAVIATLFAATGGITLGGLIDLVADGVVVWTACGLGMIGGLLVYSLCVVAGESAITLESDNRGRSDTDDE